MIERPKNDSTKKLSVVSDLSQRRVGVLMGSAHETWVSKNLPQATMLQYKTVADVTLALETGKVDAALYDAEVLRDLMRQDQRIGRLEKDLFAFDVGVGFAKQSVGLRTDFDQFLTEIRANGIYKDMVQRWIEQRKTEMPSLKNIGTNGELVVGVCDVGMPFVATQENQLVGFDIELMERFAGHLGKKLRLSNMDFSSLIAAVASGKADLVTSSIYITPERQQQIDFSLPYFQMATQVGVLKSSLLGSATETPSEATFLQRLTNSIQSNLIRENRYLLILDGLKTTVIISILSALLGTVLGAVLCFMRMSSQPLLHVPARLYISLLRGTPVLVVLMLVFYVLFASIDIPPTLAAVLAFGMNFAAYAAEIFRSGIDGVDRGQLEAGLAMGFTRFSTFRFIVLPQMVRNILPIFKGEFISLLKMTSIVGYIAVQDLTKAGDIIRSRTFDPFFPLIMVAILYWLIAGLFILLIDLMQRRMVHKSPNGIRRFK